MNTVVTLLTASNVVIGTIPVAVDIALKIKEILQSNTDVKVQIQAIRDGAMHTIADTEIMIAQWKASQIGQV